MSKVCKIKHAYSLFNGNRTFKQCTVQILVCPFKPTRTFVHYFYYFLVGGGTLGVGLLSNIGLMKAGLIIVHGGSSCDINELYNLFSCRL